MNSPGTESPNAGPLVSIVILNYNGEPWLPKCLASIRSQSIFDQLEIIVADNASPDASDRLAAELMRGWKNGRVVQHGKNLGFCEGNNRGARSARGEYLFFLNNDTWLEPDCMEKLVAGVKQAKAQAATPLMVNYEDDSIQSSGGAGFDLFGLMSLAPRVSGELRDVFVVGGCCYLIERELFHSLGEFDPRFFMYAEEYDLSWRLWISGATAVIVPAARMHHRGAASVNPTGGEKMVEPRTSDSKRFFTNRNCLLVVAKNCRHFLLLTLPMQMLLLIAEALFSWAVFRRWSFVKRAYIDAVAAVWGLRGHVLTERRRIAAFRRRGDLQMLRFFRLRLNRWDEFQNVRRHGLPQVTAR